jgi:hypothetical protein
VTGSTRARSRGHRSVQLANRYAASWSGPQCARHNRVSEVTEQDTKATVGFVEIRVHNGLSLESTLVAGVGDH